MSRLPAAWLLLVATACETATDSGDEVVYAGPELDHTAPSSPQAGADVTLSVTATDPEGVAQVLCYYRTEGQGTWTPATITQDGDVWTASVPGADVAAPALEYYFKAADLGDPEAVSYLPTGSTQSPFSLPVGVVGRPFPFSEDFEPEEGQYPAIADLGWLNASQTFRGYAWELSENHASSGNYSVYHARGSSEVSIPPEDWLISPAIDLSGTTTAQVRWRELGLAVENANHGLYISTGSFDPADGAFVPVAEVLPAPLDKAWGESASYDLTAWVGNVVYLAWRFEGTDADDWFLDDIEVGPLEPALSADWTVAPSPIHAGDTGTLSVTVQNASTLAAEAVSVTVTFPDGGAEVSTATLEAGAVAAGGSTAVDFDLLVDAATPENSYVPVEVTLTTSARSVTEAGQLLVGQASTAVVDFNPDDLGALSLIVGVGDPDAPTWSTEVFSGTADVGTVRYTADITDAWAWLAPAAGDHRWWAYASTSAGGTLESFTIRYEGADFESTMAPLAIDALESDVCYLPEPPDPQWGSYSTNPSELDPGTTGFTLDLKVRNAGAESAGPVWATLVSADADLTVVDGGPVLLDPDLFEASEVATLSGVFVADVAATHVDSSDLKASLVLDDGVESWTLDLDLPVPYPVLAITGVTIDDDGGDGILDPDESADLEFRVTNIGDEGTTGQVRGVLSVEATSTATAVAGDNDESVGSLTAGETRSVDDFTVQVTGGAAGDTVDLLLTLTDSVRTYEARQQLVLGEPPWQPMNDLGDDAGDVLGAGDFDAVQGWYRYLGGTLQMRLVSDTAFDASHLFVEAWATSPAADYGIYRILAQSGAGTLQGYDFTTGTFYDLDDPTVSYPDAYTVQLDLPVSYLQLTFDELSIGFGAGWCGEPDYYCDHYPDGWGYPYTGYDSSDWFDLEW